MNENDSLFRLIATLLGLAGYIGLFTWQFRKVLKTRDVVTPLRMIMLCIFMLAIVTLVPGIFYQVSVLLGEPNQTWRRTSVYTTSVNQIATLALIIVFAKYRIKEEAE